MSKHRISVEHGFGQIQKYWMRNSFHLVNQVGNSPVAAYYLVAALMSNIITCLRGNQISRHFDCAPPSLNEYFEVFGVHGQAAEQVEGVAEEGFEEEVEEGAEEEVQEGEFDDIFD
ncbi:hypothetical protein DTO212C5_106 [Paecilomyces variotii]|nr:hypothetical protein DTO212C5_106 [Paecilomyces variotii]